MAQPEALAFDMYGTLVDPIAISEQLEGYLAQQTQRVALVWRQKQLETTRWQRQGERSRRTGKKRS
jgi:2-haloacid dehalogenase